MDVVAGEGSRLMNAAGEGHHAGRESTGTHLVGLRIKPPAENQEAVHLDIKKESFRFSNRLESFTELSKAVVVASVGVGTLLELFYMWRLMQAMQISDVPIILLGDMWVDLVRWIRKWPLKR